MQLTYRGIKYSSNNSTVSTPIEENDCQIIYRGQSVKAAIAPKFPFLNYFKQLFSHGETKPVFAPMIFWYKHKKQFLENCWQLDEIEQLDLCWKITLKIERERALKRDRSLHNEGDRPIKLKYRGVTYYR